MALPTPFSDLLDDQDLYSEEFGRHRGPRGPRGPWRRGGWGGGWGRRGWWPRRSFGPAYAYPYPWPWWYWETPVVDPERVSDDVVEAMIREGIIAPDDLG